MRMRICWPLKSTVKYTFIINCFQRILSPGKCTASTVDKKILDKLKSQWPDEDWTLAEDRFNSRINAMPLHHQAIAIAAYAAPVNSQLQYSMSGQES